jgi:hypothetical protein
MTVDATAGMTVSRFKDTITERIETSALQLAGAAHSAVSAPANWHVHTVRTMRGAVMGDEETMESLKLGHGDTVKASFEVIRPQPARDMFVDVLDHPSESEPRGKRKLRAVQIQSTDTVEQLKMQIWIKLKIKPQVKPCSARASALMSRVKL